MTGASSSSQRRGTSMRRRAPIRTRAARHHRPGAARPRRRARQSARRPTWSAAAPPSSGTGTSTVTVTQTTDRARSSTGTRSTSARARRTQFVQPSATSIALNRVTGGLGPSQIYGTLTANGRVFLVNPDGILIGRGAVDQHRGLPGDHPRHHQRQLHGGPLSIQHSGPAGRLDRQRRHHQRAQPRLCRAGRAGRAQQRHHHRDASARSGSPSGNGFSLDFYGDKLITLGGQRFDRARR